MNTKPTAIKRLFMSLTVSVGLLPGPLLHAEEQPNAETQVLKGKIVVEAGTQYLLLKAPIELDGKTIEKLELVKDKDDKNTEGIKMPQPPLKQIDAVMAQVVLTNGKAKIREGEFRAGKRSFGFEKIFYPTGWLIKDTGYSV